MSNKKDIYELLNDIEFDITSENEIPIDDIQKKRIKKSLKSRIKSPKSLKKKYISIAAIVICILTLISPMGREIVAKIVDGIFFNPGLGLVNTEEEIYVLQEPIVADMDGKKLLIKSVLSKKESLLLEMWIENDIGNYKGEPGGYIDNLKDNSFAIKLPSGEILNSTSYYIGMGGKNIAFGKSFETEDYVKEFILLDGEEEIANIYLVKPDKLDSYNGVGGNSTDKGIMIGGNKYNFSGDTYISLWNKDESNLSSYISYDKDSMNITDKNGKAYKIEPSEYTEQGNEFVINGEINNSLDLNISKIGISYSLINKPNIKVRIPKEGETIELNQEIYFSDIDEKILLNNIKATNEGIDVYIDTSKFKKEDSSIVTIMSNRKHSLVGYRDKYLIVMNFDYEDLTTIEKMTGKLNFDIEGVNLIKEGNWNFEIK